MEILIPSTFNLLSAALCLCLGIVVLAGNPRKLTHQAFALLACNFMLWALGVYFIINSKDAQSARLWIILTETVACFIPAACYLFTGYFPRGRFEGSRIILGLLLASGLIFATLAPTALYVKEVTYIPNMPPKLVHGPVIIGVMISLLVSIVSVHTNLRRKMRKSQGQVRRQIQFVLFGIYSIAGLGFVVTVLGDLLHLKLFQAYGPISTALIMGIFAYAMIRFHLLDTRLLVSRTIVYFVATVFVVACYSGFLAMTQWFVGDPIQLDQIVPILLASVFIALILPKVKRGTAQIVEGRLLRRPYDINQLYRRVSQEAAEEVQLSELLRTVADHIESAIAVRSIRVLLIEDNDPHLVTTVFSTVPDEVGTTSHSHAALLSYLRVHHQPLMLEKILHQRPSESMLKIAEHLAEMDAYFCMPLRTSDGLVGMLALGQKKTGDVFSEEELTAFRALGGPLGTAIANARLYEALENVNLHLSQVMGQMREGVVAVDSRGVVTTINDSAAKFFGPLKPGHTLDALTPAVAEVLRSTLRDERSISDFETTIPGADGEEVPVVMSSSVMKSPGHDSSGAVALIYDLSPVKRLEQNILRADRLSSLGVLAAGMAHEIKNPLVSIKTFSQLLLKRYTDPDFRATFEETVPGEVDRINSIVSRLLEFAKPRPVQFTRHPVRQIIDAVLVLVENQTRKAKVEVMTHYPVDEAMIEGDEQQLHQVFLNLVLNALDAIESADREADAVGWRGRLDITIRVGHARLRSQGIHAISETECVIVEVSDTGSGIHKSDLKDLFTPFFTTKEEGSGLGLSVVHGIVNEHGGTIDVSSTSGVGTTFTVTLPLCAVAEAMLQH